MAQTAQNSAFDVLKIPDYRNYFLARSFNTFAFNLLGTTVGWQVYELTRDPLSLGLVGLAEFLPFVLVTLVGGYVADRLDRRRIILACLGLYLVCAAALFGLSQGEASLLARYGALPVYLIVGGTGLVRGFLSPSVGAFAAQLVPSKLYANAATWNSMSWHISSVGGPAAGGLLCGLSGSAGPGYAAAGLLTLAGLLLMSRVAPKPLAANAMQKEGFLGSVKTGLDFVFRKQVILGSLALDMFAVLFGGAVALLPAFAKEVLAVGPEGFGALRAAPAAGALVMALILAYRPPTRRAGRKLLLAVAGFGLCTIFFALSTNFWLSLLMLAGTGFFDNVSMVIRGTVVQLFTPDEMRGRVSAVNSLFIGSSNELGAFESGITARWMGLVPAVLFGGAMTLVVVATAWLRAPKLRELDLR